jgi:hypothetical protein
MLGGGCHKRRAEREKTWGRQGTSGVERRAQGQKKTQEGAAGSGTAVAARGPHSQQEGNSLRNMLATECSRPMATNAAIGGQMPSTLPGRLLAAPAFHTATHTSQLAITARMNA